MDGPSRILRVHEKVHFERVQSYGIDRGIFNDVQGNQYHIYTVLHINLGALSNAAEQFSNVNQHKAVLGDLSNRVGHVILEVDAYERQARSPLMASKPNDINRFEANLLQL